MGEHICETCKFREPDVDYGDWYCTNSDSPYRGMWVDPEVTCGAWNGMNACGNCGSVLDEKLREEYKIDFCPYCGKKL